MSKSTMARTRKAIGVKTLPASLALPPAESSEMQRHAMVSEAAYYRAQKRGFEPGRELEDWLAAEAEIKACSLISDPLPELH